MPRRDNSAGDPRPARGASPVLYELRQYRVASGRNEDEIARALACILPRERGGMGLFARYEIPEPVGLWRALAGPSLPCVVFLYRWEGARQRAHAFGDFYNDAEWQELRARTNGAGEIVERMDDLLLTGPALPELPTAGVFEFVRSSAPLRGPNVCVSLSPLCGKDDRPLSIVHHSSGDAAFCHSHDDHERLLCERLTMGGPS
jgi:hypothetical protein